MKAILIDDESLALEFLHKQINQLESIEVINKFTYFNVEQHEDLLKNIDLVFLDIEMPEVNGMELADKILQINPNLEIIFVTAYSTYAVEAFELNALDYLLKPLQLERLKNTINRIEKIQPVKTSETSIEIQVGKELALKKDGETLQMNWRTTKTKELFLYLLHNHGESVRKDFLADFLWPDFEAERANAQLYTAVYHVRKSLRPFSEYFNIKSTQAGYLLELNNVKIDLVEWEKQLDALPPLDSNQLDKYEEVLANHKGPYLEACNYLWSESERFRLEEKWLKLAYEIGYFNLAANHSDKAKDIFTSICQRHPDEENAFFQLMKLYAADDNKQMVSILYERLTQIYEDLSIPVNQEFKNWFDKWEKEDGIDVAGMV